MSRPTDDKDDTVEKQRSPEPTSSSNQDLTPVSNDLLHGVTLERMLTELSEHYGWEKMGRRISIKCFTTNPSIKSSLAFLRKTPWARGKVEVMYRWYRQKSRSGSTPRAR